MKTNLSLRGTFKLFKDSLGVTLFVAMILTAHTGYSAVSCDRLFDTRSNVNALSDPEYDFYAKKFAEGRIRERSVPNFESWDDSPKFLLRPAEQAAIYFYTFNPNFVGMNSPLRIGKPSEQIDPYINAAIKLAISGLSKLPDYKGLVYRGGVRNEKFYDEVVEKYKVGTVITEKTFLSTSKGSCWSCDFRHGPLVDFFINSKTGKEIDDISVNPKEREVLFLPGTQFKVDKVENSHRLKIWLTEI